MQTVRSKFCGPERVRQWPNVPFSPGPSETPVSWEVWEPMRSHGVAGHAQCVVEGKRPIPCGSVKVPHRRSPGGTVRTAMGTFDLPMCQLLSCNKIVSVRSVVEHAGHTERRRSRRRDTAVKVIEIVYLYIVHFRHATRASRVENARTSEHRRWPLKGNKTAKRSLSENKSHATSEQIDGSIEKTL
jgi:hypothetical protein